MARRFFRILLIKKTNKFLLKKVKGTALKFLVTMTAFSDQEEIAGLKWDAIDFIYKRPAIKHTVTEAIVNG